MTAKVVAQREGVEYDVTEAVKTMYDLLHSSMDWGSGFLSIEDVIEVTRLAALCEFVNLDGANEQIEAFLRTLSGHCPICNTTGTFELGEVTPEGRNVRLSWWEKPARHWVPPSDHYTVRYPDPPAQPKRIYDEHEGLLVQPPNEPASLIWPTSTK